MKLRCIGGILDGEYKYVDDILKIGDWVRFIEEPQRSKLVMNFDPHQAPELITMNYIIYKISVFNFSKDDEYLFLVPEKWSNKEAILHQFKK